MREKNVLPISHYYFSHYHFKKYKLTDKKDGFVRTPVNGIEFILTLRVILPMSRLYKLLLFLFCNTYIYVFASPDSLVITRNFGYESYPGLPYGLMNRSETYYDSTGKKSSTLTQTWNGYRFKNEGRILYTYDNSGHLIIQTGQVGSGIIFIDANRTVNYYNSFGKIDSTVQQNIQSNNWVTTWMPKKNTYNASNQLIVELTPVKRFTHYPAANNHDTLIIEETNYSTGWTIINKKQLFFDASGHLINTIIYAFDSNFNFYRKSDSTTYSYHANDSLFVTHHFNFPNDIVTPGAADSIMYSGDTIFNYSATFNTTTQTLDYIYRDVAYNDRSGYNFYYANNQTYTNGQWSSNENWKCEYDSVNNTAHEENNLGSYRIADYIFDSDGHLVSVTGSSQNSAGDSFYGTTYYYYYLTLGMQDLCPGNTDSLRVDAGMNSYSWNTGGNTNHKNINTSGEYFCDLVNQYNHPFQSEPHIVSPSFNPSFPTAQDSSIHQCSNVYFTLKAIDIPMYDYQWYRNDSIILNETSAELYFSSNRLDGNYNLIVSNGCGSDTSSITTIDFSPDRVYIQPSGTYYLCPGDTLWPIADSGYVSYLWNTGDTGRQVMSTIYHVNYYVTVTDSNGCTASPSAQIHGGFNPDFLPLTFTQDDSLLTGLCSTCDGQWYLNGVAISGVTKQSLIVTQSGYYKYLYFGLGCNIFSEEKYVNISPYRVSFNSSSYKRCINQPFNLSGSYQVHGGIPPFHYLWSPATGLNNDTIPFPILSVTGNTMYTLAISDSAGNQVRDTVHIDIVSPVNNIVIATQEDTICRHQSGYYYGTDFIVPYLGNGDYKWYLNNTLINVAADNNFTAEYPGTYQLRYDNGCISNSNTINITGLHEPPVAVIQHELFPSDWCHFDSLRLIANLPNSSLYQIEWSHFIHGHDIVESGDTIFAKDNSNYQLTVTGSNGCKSYSNLDLRYVVPLTPVNFSLNVSGPLLACYEDTVQLSETNDPRYTYSWYYFGNLLQGDSSSINALMSGNYWVIADNGFGCRDTDSVFVVFSNPVPDVTLFNDGNDLIAASHVYVTDYLWYRNDTLISSTYSNRLHPSKPGWYKLIINSASACGQASDSIFVACTVTINYTDISCASSCNSSATFLESGNAPFVNAWSTGSTATTLNNLCAGIYSITMTDGNGCMAIDSVTIEDPQQLSLAATITAASCSSCTDGNIALHIHGGTAPYSINWNTGDSTSTIAALGSGNYIACVTDNHLCQKCDTFGIGILTRVISPDIYQELIIYPNPFTQDVTIQINYFFSGEEYKVYVKNSLGEIIISEKTRQNMFSLYTVKLNAGIYFIEVWDRVRLVSVKKMIKVE